MRQALRTLGINVPTDDIMPMLMNVDDVSCDDTSQQKKINALKTILKNYIQFIPQNTRSTITKSKDVVKIMHPILKGIQQEQLWLITLNRANQILNIKMMSQGGLDSVIIDIKAILSQTLKDKASSLIIVHNHPSGKATPGKADIEQTHKLRTSSNCMELQLLDHIIISDNEYYSFADEILTKITDPI